MDEATLKIRLEVLGGDNLTNMRKLKKELDAAFALTTKGTPEHDRLGAGIRNLKERIADFTSTTETAAAKVQKAYFQMGTALRSSTLAGMNFSRILQDMPYGLMGVANNINPLLESLQRLRQEGLEKNMTAWAAFRTMFVGPNALGIVVGAATAAMVLLPKLLEDTGKKAKEAADTGLKDFENQLDRIMSKMDVMSGGQSQAMVSTRQKELGQVKGRYALFSQMLKDYQSGNSTISITEEQARAAGIFGQSWMKMTIEDLKKAIDELLIKWRTLQLEIAAAGAGGSTVTGEGPSSGGGSGSGQSADQTWENWKKIQSGARGNMLPPAGGGVGRINAPGTVPGVTGPKRITTQLTSTMVADWTVLANNMGATLTSALTQGFMEGFQNGTNLLKAFQNAVISTLMAIVAQQSAIAIVSGILSLAGFGPFAVISQALGGLITPGASVAGAQVAPKPGVGVGPTLEKINDSINSLELRVDSVGLYMGVSRGKLLKEAR